MIDLTNMLKPDWVSECGRAALYRADCLDILPQLPDGVVDGVVDAVVTDPPYGIAYSPGGGGRSAFGKGTTHKKFTRCDLVIGDSAAFDPSPFLNFESVILWGGNYFAQSLPPSPAWLVWDKHLAESGLSFSEAEMAWTNLSSRVLIMRHLWNGVCKGSECGKSRDHPTQKPIALMRWCIEKTTGTVLDPFMGSGTTGVAAAQLGRDFIGVEIDAKYFDIAVNRIKAALAQGRLFDDVAPAVKAEQIEAFTE